MCFFVVSHEGSEIPANAAEEVSAKKVEIESEEPVVDYDEKLEEYKEKIERLCRLRDRMKDLEKEIGGWYRFSRGV